MFFLLPFLSTFHVLLSTALKGRILFMIVKVLGSGCKKCGKLYENVEQAAKNKGLEITIEKVTDFKEIVAYGVMKTPALVVDEEVKVSGRVAKTSEIEAFLD